jgi:hypothetical protein
MNYLRATVLLAALTALFMAVGYFIRRQWCGDRAPDRRRD